MHRRSLILPILLGTILLAIPAPTRPAEAAEPLARAKPTTFIDGVALPTGARITPTALTGSRLDTLDPKLPGLPDFRPGGAVAAKLSPDGRTLLVLTSGYNRNNGPNGRRTKDWSNEYVFVFDVSAPLSETGAPRQRQVLQVPNTFNGIAWAPDGMRFFVSGGVDDCVHIFTLVNGSFVEDAEPIDLAHRRKANGIDAEPIAAGVAVNPSGTRLLVTNYQNDSVTLIDLVGRSVVAELDLRPGKLDPARAGVPGGEYPFAVVWQSETRAYVTSQRDRELVQLSVADAGLSVGARIPLKGQPNNLLLNGARERLYVVCDNSDTVVVFEAGDNDFVEEISVAAPSELFRNAASLKGANPNNLALSPDERTLFVTNGDLNALAVVALSERAAAGAAGPAHSSKPASDKTDDDDDKPDAAKSRVIGLIPTGWYPNAVAVARDGSRLWIVNGKDTGTANPGGCRDTLSTGAEALEACRSRNQYSWQLEHAGLLSAPMPSGAELAAVSWQAAYNNNFPATLDHQRSAEVMADLRKIIRHVIYVVKENRGYDQVLGDLEIGNGDPSLTLLPDQLSPNHHQIARQWVTLDNFYDSGEASISGWNWVTAARTTDFGEKAYPLAYSGRGPTYDSEGLNRNINVGLATLAERRATNPALPDDPDILPGTADVSAPDAPGGEAGTGYLWDGALRAGLSLRNYGFFGDFTRYDGKKPGFLPPSDHPFDEKAVQFIPTKASLVPYSDVYYRSFDMTYPDTWRIHEWAREFDRYAASRTLPALSLVRLPNDHFGAFASARRGLGTVEGQMADNDYALGFLMEKIAQSPFRDDTVIIAVEDDAQDAADHVDPHRSIALFAGAKVKRNWALVSEHATSVSVLRTIEDLLGMAPLGINDGLAEPLAAVFDPNEGPWTYTAIVPAALRETDLPLPPGAGPTPRKAEACPTAPPRDAAYWTNVTRGQDFSQEDHLDTKRFNEALWIGLKGDNADLPAHFDPRDLSTDRGGLLAAYRACR